MAHVLIGRMASIKDYPDSMFNGGVEEVEDAAQEIDTEDRAGENKSAEGEDVGMTADEDLIYREHLEAQEGLDAYYSDYEMDFEDRAGKDEPAEGEDVGLPADEGLMYGEDLEEQEGLDAYDSNYGMDFEDRAGRDKPVKGEDLGMTADEGLMYGEHLEEQEGLDAYESDYETDFIDGEGEEREEHRGEDGQDGTADELSPGAANEGAGGVDEGIEPESHRGTLEDDSVVIMEGRDEADAPGKEEGAPQPMKGAGDDGDAADVYERNQRRSGDGLSDNGGGSEPRGAHRLAEEPQCAEAPSGPALGGRERQWDEENEPANGGTFLLSNIYFEPPLEAAAHAGGPRDQPAQADVGGASRARIIPAALAGTEEGAARPPSAHAAAPEPARARGPKPKSALRSPARSQSPGQPRPQPPGLPKEGRGSGSRVVAAQGPNDKREEKGGGEELPSTRPDSEVVMTSMEEKALLQEQLKEAEEKALHLQEAISIERNKTQAAAWKAHAELTVRQRRNEEEINSLKDKCQALEVERDALRAQVEQYREQHETQAKAITSLVLEKQKLEQRLVDAASFAKELDGALKEANDAIEELKPNVNSEIEAVRSIVRKVFEGAAAVTESYENEVAELRREVEQARKESMAASETLKEFRIYVEQELTDITDNLLAAKEHARSARYREAEAVKKMRQVTDVKNRQIAEANAELDRLRKELSKSRKEAAGLKRVVKEVNEHLASSQDACKNLKHKVEEKDNEVWRLRTKLAEDALAAKATASNPSPMLSAGEADLAAAKKEAAKATAKMRAAVEKAQAMELDRDKLLKNVKIIEGEVKALTNALTREQEKLANARTDVANSIQRRRAAEMSLGRLQDENKELKALSSDTSKMLEDARRDLETWQGEAQEWRKEATHLLVKCKNLEKQKAAGTTMADTGSQELMQKVRDAEAQALEFKSEAAVLKEMIHTLKVEVRQKSKSEKELRRKLKQLQDYQEMP